MIENNTEEEEQQQQDQDDFLTLEEISINKEEILLAGACRASNTGFGDPSMC